MIPERVSVTYCKTCEHAITERRLCLSGCKWDGNYSNERPVVVVTYWRRD